jgi:type IV pilus assembly protein PilB
MSVLSAVGEKQVQEVLVSTGMIDAAKLEQAKKEAKSKNQPLIGYLLKKGYISDEQLTNANATVTKVPYVNLTKAKVDPAVLQLLPQDIAERYMAVPLGEMQHRLVVAMLDAGNVQAVDYLSNRIGRPLKVYVASEAGIRQVLKQYSTRLDTQMQEVLARNAEEQAAEAVQDNKAKGIKPEAKNIKTIVQDSPISKALSAIMEFAARNRASDIHIETL